ncbi:MAG: hypothetical protein FAF03_11480 [Epsilonproteobacteria bacterium]|nr:hypothetical protein [Campylobacterota bacterium]
MNYKKPSLENRTLILLLGSLYLALILMVVISLTVYKSNLQKQYEENINFLSTSLQEIEPEKDNGKIFEKCQMTEKTCVHFVKSTNSLQR